MRSPVLFLVFNRPETTKVVFDAIRAARPPKLYEAADGPRLNHNGEDKLCQAVREMFDLIDWPCELKTLFQTRNLGCKLGVSAGINWFFECEEEGVILEDDVLPIPSFFIYCDELLERYRNDDRIGIISGSNLITNKIKIQDSYFFSRVPLIWGWASWRRAWQNYDVNMRKWKTWDASGALKQLFPKNPLVISYWRDAFNRVYEDKLSTWDYQLILTRWMDSTLTVIPAHNLTDNLGYGLNATHTSNIQPRCLIESRPKNLNFPLQHPKVVSSDSARDLLIFKYVHEINFSGFIRRQLRPLRQFFNH